MKTVFCPLCRQPQAHLQYRANIAKEYFDRPYRISDSEYGRHRDIYRCLHCHILFEDMRHLENRITKHYQTLADAAYERERDNRAAAFRRIAGQLKKMKTWGKLLDIGCATGAFLVEARNAGFETFGIEPSTWATRIAQKKHSLNVVTGRIETVKISGRAFDVVTMLDVIEHCLDPFLVLQRVHKITKKGGLICIVTPNVDSLAARIFGENWWHIRPSHFFYFSPSTITALLKKAGFKIVLKRRYKWYLSAGYLGQRLLKMLSVNLNLERSFLNKITVPIDLFDSLEIYAARD